MNLTTVNTLAFLKDLVEQYELHPIEGSKFFHGMDAGAYLVLVCACRRFTGFEGTITDQALREFVEAIKND